jgi:hypothetical protein
VNPSSGCTATQLLGNPGFETGTAAPWTASAANVIEPASAGEAPHSGNYDVWMGFGTAIEASILQKVNVPAGCTNYTFSYWLHIDNSGSANNATMHVIVFNSAGAVVQTLAGYSNANANSGYAQHSFNLAAYAGQTITLKFTSKQFSTTGRTNFVVDDTAFNVS